MRVALDTNIISYLWRKDPQVRASLESLDPADVAVPSVVLAELVYGRHNNPGAALKLEMLIQDLRHAYPVLAFDAPAADWYGLLKARFKGRTMPDRDLMIASTCLAHGHALATHNGKDFERIQELTLLDWVSP